MSYDTSGLMVKKIKNHANSTAIEHFTYAAIFFKYCTLTFLNFNFFIEVDLTLFRVDSFKR